jgi:hypothetical protein
MIVFEEQLKFRILCNEQLSSEVCGMILKKFLDCETNFKAYCRNYVIKVDKNYNEDMNEIVLSEFTAFPIKYYYSLTPL